MPADVTPQQNLDLYRLHSGPRGKTFIKVRSVAPEEYAAVQEARNLVALFAYRTPFHHLTTSKKHVDQAWQALSSDDYDGAEAIRTRAIAALKDFATSVQAQGSQWVKELGRVAPSGLARDKRFTKALEDFNQSATIRFANLVCVSTELQVAPTDRPGDLPWTFLVEESPHDLETIAMEWLRQGESLLSRALESAQAAIDSASSTIMHVIADGLGDPVFVAPTMLLSSKDLSFEIDLVDPHAVESVQDLIIQIQNPARDPDPSGASNAGIAQESLSGEGETPTDTDPLSQSVQQEAESASGDDRPTLPELTLEIHKVVEAMANSRESLLDAWSSRFPESEYMLAVETEKALAGSLTTTVNRAMEATIGDDRTADARNWKLPASPPELLEWLNSAPESSADIACFHLTALVHALQRYLGTLQATSRPSRFELNLGSVTAIEFSPLRAVHLYDNAALLAETATDLGRRVGSPQMQVDLGVGLDPTDDSELRRLVRAARACRATGLPEGELLYLVRLFDWLAPKLSSDHMNFVARARQEVSAAPSNRVLATSISLILANELARILDTEVLGPLQTATSMDKE